MVADQSTLPAYPPPAAGPALQIPDFAMAESYLGQAREAHAVGDDTRCTAACQMVALALGIQPVARVPLRALKSPRVPAERRSAR